MEKILLDKIQSRKFVGDVVCCGIFFYLLFILLEAMSIKIKRNMKKLTNILIKNSMVGKGFKIAKVKGIALSKIEKVKYLLKSDFTLNIEAKSAKIIPLQSIVKIDASKTTNKIKRYMLYFSKSIGFNLNKVAVQNNVEMMKIATTSFPINRINSLIVFSTFFILQF